MSLQAMVWAVEDAPDVPPHCVAVLQGLANHADRDGRNAYPAVELLAHYARKTSRAVQKDLRELEHLGLIGRGDQRAAYDIPERYRPTVWDLAMAAKRPPYLPARLRDTPSPTAEPSRGALQDTPADGEGCTTGSSGVYHSAPEPAPKPQDNYRGVGTSPTPGAVENPAPQQTAAEPSPATPGDDGPQLPARLPSSLPLPVARPAEQCPVHLGWARASVPDCPGCGRCRRAAQVWDAEAAAVAAAERRDSDELARRQAAQARADLAAELAACGLCDGSGTAVVQLDGTEAALRCLDEPARLRLAGTDRSLRCLHDAGRNRRQAAERAAAKATLAARPRRAPADAPAAVR